MAKKELKRFVPRGDVSLSEDAPGWAGEQAKHPSSLSSGNDIVVTNDEDTGVPLQADTGLGPICWKCKGTGVGKKPSKSKICTVCDGIGRLPSKKREREAKTRWGEITQPRRSYPGWEDFGPQPRGLSEHDANSGGVVSHAVALVRQAERTMKSVEVILASNDDDDEGAPAWLPRRGEQLCNLVGRWRILQCVGSHRWTTDDLVTAYVAAKQVEQMGTSRRHEPFRYLDLGTGNGSVLTMTTWKICQLLHERCKLLQCVGIEARREAFGLNRRSLSYNVGIEPGPRANPGCCPIQATVLRGDFRELPHLLKESSIWDAAGHGNETADKLLGGFDVVTGTPPYFRVDFHVAATQDGDNKAKVSRKDGRSSLDDETKKTTVQRAVINEGGMPSCLQSAPARCEFRGGIEAYCHAAQLALHPTRGVFCVCENWINHQRVLNAAHSAGLDVINFQPVHGSTRKNIPLFCVYTMKVAAGDSSVDADAEEKPNNASHDPFGAISTQATTATSTRRIPPLSVRDADGKWTREYATQVLEYMSIPAQHETAER